MHDTLRGGALPVLAALACGESTPPGPPLTADTIPPAVVTLSPAPGDTGVSLLARVEVTFSEPINGATLGPASYFLLKDLVPVPVSYLVDRAAATLLPDRDLDSVTVYTASLTSAVRDSAGNRVPRDTTWSFRTGASVPRAAGPVGSRR